ncbi:MAG: outer membrane protein assembly factor BamD [Chitinivibrionales bacterium]|nr:outer membrane protein assembly factor BamD [Chitinivibrionales bacterium]
MKRWKLLAIIGAVMMMGLSTGCSHITMLRTEELRGVQAHVDTLKIEMVELQGNLLEQQKANHELLRLIRADQQVRFGELNKKIGALENGISESQQRLSKIDEKTQVLKQGWEEKARVDSLAESMKRAEIEKLFQLAYDDFMARRYDLAISGFKDLKDQYPQSPQAEEATYWIAECAYAQEKYDEAAEGYKNYVKEYPEGKKICVTFYKMGMVFEKKNKKKSRDMVWQRLIEQCPETEEALAVKQRMK